jgi:hypothetical protein
LQGLFFKNKDKLLKGTPKELFDILTNRSSLVSLLKGTEYESKQWVD